MKTIFISIFLMMSSFLLSGFGGSIPIFGQNTSIYIDSIPYYLFPEEIEGVEEEALKIPHDAFTLNTIVAKKGDNVTIKFFNTEANEPHSFTLDKPYGINVDLKGGQNSTINFVADKEGIFTYYCIYHLPTMTGKLMVTP